MKKIMFFILVTLLLIVSVDASACADSYGSVSEAMNAVARVYTEGTTEEYRNGRLIKRTENQPIGSGSCFAVGDKKPVSYFVTNRHVVEDEESTYEDDRGDTILEKIHVTDVYIIMDDIPTKWPATVITLNEGASDLAILRLNNATYQREPGTLHPYTDPISEGLIGSDVWSIGYPGISDYLYKNVKTTDDLIISSLKNLRTAKGSFTGGIDADISSTGGSYIETNATISPGNSGGPLVDEYGGILGVCTTMSTEVVGANGAVSVNEVTKLLNKHGIAYLTAETQTDYTLYLYAGLGAAVALLILILTFVLLRRLRNSRAGVRDSGTAGVESRGETHPQLGGKRTLYAISGPLSDRQYTIRAGEKLKIGRNPQSCAVCFANGTPGISAEHCEILFDGNTASIRDLYSRYGTYVNGKKLEPGKLTRLHRGGSIDIGSSKNRFTLQ